MGTAIGPAYGGESGAPAAAGGIVRVYESAGLDPGVAPSTSSNATKGLWVDCTTNMTVSGVQCGLEGNSGQTYRVFVAKEAATPFEVDSIVATSELLPGIENSMIAAVWCDFSFAETFDLVAGEKYFFGLQVTSGTATTSCGTQFGHRSMAPNLDIAPAEIALFAGNTVPAPGFDIGESGVANAFLLKLTYVRT